ncbi:hypothetical protein DK926_10705 [Rhodococcus sp. Eu-32]|uniref:hypothetical protein n=1 Tax=Rhodococcus sp. Eu-32 TaxID=1017319 RepID=UPI000DF44F20|nr:hypothetical protein [Rhodococcus sp. Eu-32]RRQ27845.1 hypothetical protein DK926_10705 [Rhodococcus sp. Eu-32]
MTVSTAAREAPSVRTTTHRVMTIALVLIAAQLVVRAYVVASGNFYWDDLILTGRGSAFSLFSTDLLLYDHDGHFMPAAFVVAGLQARIAPLDWFLPAVTSLIMQAAASYAVLRLLRKILGDTPILLLPLTFYLFSPLTLPSFAWWAAALNALPLQFALAWVAGDALDYVRTRRRRHVVTGAVVTAVSLLFFEKSVVVPLFAFGVVAFVFGVRAAWKRAAPLWCSCGVVVAVWAVLFLIVVRAGLAFHGWRTTAELVHHGTSLGLVPTLVGGPWMWERWPPAGPWASPPLVLVVAAWVAVVVAAVFSLRRHWSVWAAVVGYVAVSVAVMVLSRSGPDTANELAQTLRYVADSSVVITVGAALMLRSRAGGPVRRTWIVVAAVFVISSLVSSYTFVSKWQDDPAGDYLATAKHSLADHRDIPLLDQAVSPWVLTPLAYPENSAARIFGSLDPNFASSTPVLQYLDDSGHVVPAVVSPSRSITQGPEAGCGYRVGNRTRMPLDAAVPNWDWTVQLNYFSDGDSVVDLELDTGDAVSVPLRSGLNTVYVRLSGAGSAVTASTTGEVCIGSGPLGVVMLANS